MEAIDDKFQIFFSKINRTISGLYRKAPIDKQWQISNNEFMECNRYA